MFGFRLNVLIQALEYSIAELCYRKVQYRTIYEKIKTAYESTLNGLQHPKKRNKDEF